MTDTSETPQTATISYADFEKLDLRIGTVVEVSEVANADKLWKIMVDLGEPTPRQVLSGIKEDYAASDLVGKQVVVLSNLEPRKLRGEFSNGMLLAGVSEDHHAILIMPDKKVPNGMKVI